MFWMQILQSKVLGVGLNVSTIGEIHSLHMYCFQNDMKLLLTVAYLHVLLMIFFIVDDYSAQFLQLSSWSIV